MALSKKRRQLLFITFSVALLFLQVAAFYGRSHRTKSQYESTALNEITQLEKIWERTDVMDLVTPTRIADYEYLRLARTRLKEAETAIQESEARVNGENHKFLQMVRAYYHHSVSALAAITDFLLEKQGAYLVLENEISFESEKDADRFKALVGELSHLHQEKESLDGFISKHNQEVEKKLIRL